VVVGVAYSATGIVEPEGPLAPRFFTSFSDYLAQYIFLVALAGTMVTVASLHASQRGRYGWTGTLGALAAFVGHLILLYVTLEQINFEASAGPGFQQVASLAILVGLVLLGLGTLDAWVLPRWCGVILIMGGVLFLGVVPFSLVGVLFWAYGWLLLGAVLGIVWA
jgi:hypothetical protein